ncbi:PD-(D/E)XK nuclease family protein [Bacillus haynesii]|uniref:PD-(D/E)XK nuclease family protein n=1 Tax=Bacillus haynesii TaxID=1925021 RepID=UPI0022803913|nr:PD-(D/E)XK nuclease family protein [Bacillus haynesii]MCY8577086.1 PD-(D/E)XK nuclease family protein [Bacillus haynesii]MEC1657216.1 PD-(D/E)XK nuclease family protein [Bacillus haynesii]
MEITVADLYDFKVCPLRFKFMKIDKVCNELTTNDGIREALQSVINYYYFHLQQGQQLPLSALKEKFSSIWHGNLDLYDIYIPDKRNKRKKELEAIGMLNNFYMKQRNEPDLVIASNLDFRIPFGTDFFVKGNIPAIRETSAGIEIVVYKMGKHKYDEFWQKTDMGLTLMAMAYESMFKQEVDSIAVHVLSSGQVHHIHRKKEDYKRLVKTIRMVRESIEKKWLYPRETYACEKCPARDLCMEWR